MESADVFEINNGDWGPFSELPSLDADREAYFQIAKQVQRCFSTPDGQAVLNMLIGSMLMRTQQPATAEQAMFERGQASVVTQILHNIKEAKAQE